MSTVEGEEEEEEEEEEEYLVGSKFTRKRLCQVDVFWGATLPCKKTLTKKITKGIPMLEHHYQETIEQGNASCGPRVGTVLEEDDGGFREKESRYSHRGRISSVAFVTEKSPESFVDDQFPWLSSKKNLGGVARRRISVAMSVGESLWLSSTEEIGGSPLQTNSSVGAKLNRKVKLQNLDFIFEILNFACPRLCSFLFASLV
ncbi:hypothetical protein YC2023_035156 [Brassica napus]